MEARMTSLVLDPHDEVDVRVGNALRVALTKLDIKIHQHRPYTFFDEIMEDLANLDPMGPKWMDQR